MLGRKHRCAKSIGKRQEKHTFWRSRWLRNAARWPQDGSKSPLGRSWALLHRSWAFFGRSWGVGKRSGAPLGPLLAALGSLLVRLEPLPADLGAAWGDLGAVLKTLGAMRVKFIDFMTPRSSGLMVPPLENPACSGALAALALVLPPRCYVAMAFAAVRIALGSIRARVNRISLLVARVRCHQAG